MKARRTLCRVICVLGLLPLALASQQSQPERTFEVRLSVVPSHPDKKHSIPAVAWLEPLNDSGSLAFTPKKHYTLLQKNRMFWPHLQVIPAGAVVDFPNADPFFHNVFSLFDGKRFDLGLYEAGSSKSVTFAREGVSYIFCNIHPEMSAVIISLSTPLYAIADRNGTFVLGNVPAGEYRLHLWMEGVPSTVLAALSRTVRVASPADLGPLTIPNDPAGMQHVNEYGKPYQSVPDSNY